jgi:hypothetical protein
MWRPRGLKVLTVLVAGALVAVVAIAFSSSSPASAGAVGRVPVVQRLTARRLRPQSGPSRPGSVVSGKQVAERIFANGRNGFALGWVSSALYPVSTADGGRVWRVDGPWLYREAADAPAGVGNIGLVLPRTFYAYGPSVIDVTPGGGHEWWQTFIPHGLLVGVVPNTKGYLLALVQQTRRHNHAVTYQYVSRDGGRHWRYSTALAGGV